MIQNATLWLACLMLLASSLKAEESKLPSVVELNNITTNEKVFEASNQKKPLVLKSHAQAKKYLAENEHAKLLGQVDFDKQVVLVFAWHGSGQDRMNATIVGTSPEQVVFVYKPGRTKDLRPHVYVYAVRSNVQWEEQKPSTKPPQEFVRVAVRGKLKTGLVAIGGETTGTTITADGITWELDFGKNKKLRQQATELDGQLVLVRGRLRKKAGVEVRQRWIVMVGSLSSDK